MRTIHLTNSEKAIENSLLKGEYINVGKQDFEEIAQSIRARKKDTFLSIRVNSSDIRNIKHKAQRLGIRYQTFISELLHKVAQA